MKRVKGFVVGYDVKHGEIVWTVKVKDPASEHNDHKFQVASLHHGTMLTKPAVDVTFRVQTSESGQEKVLRAVDVNVGSSDPEESPIVEKVPETLTFVVTVNEGNHTVWHSECKSVKDATQFYCGKEEDAVIGLVNITPELVLKHGGAISDEDAVAGLAIVRQMAYIDPIRDVMCAIAAEAFKLGIESQNAKTQN